MSFSETISQLQTFLTSTQFELLVSKLWRVGVLKVCDPSFMKGFVPLFIAQGSPRAHEAFALHTPSRPSWRGWIIPPAILGKDGSRLSSL